MPKISEEAKEQRKDQILDAALRCFGERGFQATSMADIIEESGLSAGAIYGYFESKREITLAAASRVLGGPIGRIISGDDEVRSPGEVLSVIPTILETNGLDPKILLQIWSEAAVDPEFLDMVDGIFSRIKMGLQVVLRRWAIADLGMNEARAEEWAHEVLPMAISAAQGFMVQSAVLKSFDAKKYFRIVDQVFRGPVNG